MFIEEVIGAFTGENRRTRHRQVAIGTALGLLGGAAVALLLAPQSGKETREDICKCAVKGKEAAADLAKRGYGQVKNLAGTAVDRLGIFTADMADCAENIGNGLARTKRNAARQARIAARQARRLAHAGVQALADQLAEPETADEEADSATAVESTDATNEPQA